MDTLPLVPAGPLSWRGAGTDRPPWDASASELSPAGGGSAEGSKRKPTHQAPKSSCRVEDSDVDVYSRKGNTKSMIHD